VKRQHSATYDPVELRRYMLSQPDERLLEIVTLERAQYIQPALNLAEAELRLRGVPFVVPPPVTTKTTATGAQSGSDKLFAWFYGLVCLSVVLGLVLGDNADWVYQLYKWLSRAFIGACIASVVVYWLFLLAEHLLSWLRPTRPLKH
jgi:hypothetical protein